jgi:hypothetical protein
MREEKKGKEGKKEGREGRKREKIGHHLNKNNVLAMQQKKSIFDRIYFQLQHQKQKHFVPPYKLYGSLYSSGRGYASGR